MTEQNQTQAEETQKLNQANYYLAGTIIRLEEQADPRIFWKAIREIKRFARRDNQIGTTLDEFPRFQRFWDERIRDACLSIHYWQNNITQLIGLSQKENYTIKNLKMLNKEYSKAIEALSKEFAASPHFRNSYLHRATYMPNLTKLAKAAL